MKPEGLQISAVLNGAGEALQFLIQYSTHPDVASRIDSVVDFLSYLDEVEDELTAPEHEFVEDPSRAQKGDLLPGQLYGRADASARGPARWPSWSSVTGQEYVLKVASAPEHNQRLQDEGEVLQQCRHPHIVEYCDMFAMGDRHVCADASCRAGDAWATAPQRGTVARRPVAALW